MMEALCCSFYGYIFELHLPAHQWTFSTIADFSSIQPQSEGSSKFTRSPYITQHRSFENQYRPSKIQLYSTPYSTNFPLLTICDKHQEIIPIVSRPHIAASWITWLWVPFQLDSYTMECSTDTDMRLELMQLVGTSYGKTSTWKRAGLIGYSLMQQSSFSYYFSNYLVSFEALVSIINA